MANPVKAAKQMFDQFLTKVDPESADESPTVSLRDGHNLASQGGLARAASLSPKKRRQIAKRAAKARWSNKN
jgi:hypothetical protein